ncbi:tetratricopeptide repeat protein [Sphingobacterium bovistauri]|uniref:Tetratricopeptide repeat protein n=1 Tax=Sphingobacterium bovistauri TaxID=2781959 RepID=A0ABS7Z6D8_9SPHI|nr:tetratricopeptide repeat protein [Sphingobacterium bovistauri]MCA5005127.1 tetratricopeptide repeat protein [Sphingobacterium bovistauri]
MNFNNLNSGLKSVKIGVSTLALTLLALTSSAQQEEHKNTNVRLGQKALLDGDFKSAVTYLEKALPAEEKDPNVLYLLGYSQFQSTDFKKAADTFGKVIALDAKNANAYYYKAKANNTLAVDKNSKLSVTQKEQLLQSVIADYSKAIAINTNDGKLYQNRAVAYRDLGILRGTVGSTGYNKQVATEAYTKAVADYEKVLASDANRKDIQTELKKAKVYRDLLK